MDSIALRIKTLSKRKNISIPELAKRVGKTKNTFYNYINGKTVIDVETLQKIANVLEVDVREFFGGSEFGKRKENTAENTEIELKVRAFDIIRECKALKDVNYSKLLFNYINANTRKNLDTKIDEGEKKLIIFEEYIKALFTLRKSKLLTPDEFDKFREKVRKILLDKGLRQQLTDDVYKSDDNE